MEPSKQTSNTVRLSSGQSIRPPVLGGLISGKKPAVTPDGSRVFAACGNLAIGFSTRTSRRLGVLGPLRGTVTATAGGLPGNTSADSPQAVATGSSFGELVIWDAKSLQRLSHLQFDEPVLHVSWPSKNIIMVFLGQRGATVTAEVVSVDSLESIRKLRKTPLSVTSSNGPAAATDDVIALVDGKDLVVWADGWSNSQRYTHSHPLTSVAIDPARRYVCAGDCRGVLWTWWGILEKEGVDATMAVPARWHWHANEILALEHCGPVLLSAGREGVLCVRNMEDETLQFIPRFPTALRHMTATDDGQVVCSLEDNSLAVISSIHGWVRPQYIYSVDLPDAAPVPSRRTKKRKRVQQNEEPATLPKKQTAQSRIFHNLAGCQIGISSGRRVQFLSPGEMQPSKAQRLHRGGTANSDPKQRWALQQLVFSADASCIMTCETRLSPALEHFDPASAFSCMLKWWRRTDTDQYVLDSVSNNPHAAEVTVAIANPDFRYMFATASLDGNYKLWDRLPVEEKKEGKEPLHCWQCLAMGSWQRRPIHSGCFSRGLIRNLPAAAHTFLGAHETGAPRAVWRYTAWIRDISVNIARVASRIKSTGMELRSAVRADRAAYLAGLVQAVSLADLRDPKHLYRAVRRAFPKAASKRRQAFTPLPAVEDASGQLAPDREGRQELWRGHFAALENGEKLEPGVVPTLTSVEQNVLGLRKGKACGQDGFTAELLQLSAIASARTLLPRKGKACGQDGFTAELLQLSAIASARTLLPVFVKSILGVQEPVEFRGGALMPLAKKAAAAFSCSKFRAILLSSLPSKLLHKHVRTCLSAHFQPQALQAGALPGISTESVALAARAFQAL
eukprot:s853_g18.t2